MSDDKATPSESAPETVGEPIAEEPIVEDVVVSANESLADAEAAGRVGDDTVAAETLAADAPVAEPVAAPSVDAAPAETVVMPPAPVADETLVAAPVVTASEPVPPVYSPQPIFVQAPEAPTPRGNRAAAGAIGLLAALSFAVLYIGVWVGISFAQGAVSVDSVGTALVSILTSWSLWVPVVVFFISFWLLGAIINRGRWAAWVIFGLLVGLASYGGHLLGQLFQAPFWNLTAAEGAQLVEGQLLAPLAIAAFIIGRELTIWYGSWVAARGRRMTELNIEARREYERTLEAGPQLHQY